MSPAKRRVVAVQPHEVPQVKQPSAPAPGRPPARGASTIINIRLPLVRRLEHYLDRLEGRGLKANRGMIARRALAIFLATHEDEASSSTRAGRL